MPNFYQNRNLIIKGQTPEVGNLWLGDFDSARNKKALKADKINCVLTAGLGMRISYSPDFKHKILPLYDSETENISRFFAHSFDFIDQGLKSGNVLIHCFAGVSRSTTITASYLMRKNNWTLRQTLSLIKNRRFVVCPNRGFITQLRKLQQELQNSLNSQPNSEKAPQIKKTTFKVKTQQRKPFLQGFISYKRETLSSPIPKSRIVPKTVFYSRRVNKYPQERSKTLGKTRPEVLVASS